VPQAGVYYLLVTVWICKLIFSALGRRVPFPLKGWMMRLDVLLNMRTAKPEHHGLAPHSNVGLTILARVTKILHKIVQHGMPVGCLLLPRARMKEAGVSVLGVRLRLK
jgi:hypothetical protein